MEIGNRKNEKKILPKRNYQRTSSDSHRYFKFHVPKADDFNVIGGIEEEKVKKNDCVNVNEEQKLINDRINFNKQKNISKLRQIHSKNDFLDNFHSFNNGHNEKKNIIKTKDINLKTETESKDNHHNKIINKKNLINKNKNSINIINEKKNIIINNDNVINKINEHKNNNDNINMIKNNNNNQYNNNQLKKNNNNIIKDKKKIYNRCDTGNESSRKKGLLFAPRISVDNTVLNPKNFLFENINIFNSLLIMINNVSFINKYFMKDKSKQIIQKCKSKNEYCLSMILYIMNKNMWNYKNISKIETNNLSKKYLEFIDCYKKNNCKSLNPFEYCYDLNNLELIINFIYNKINQELSAENINDFIDNNNNSMNFFNGNNKLLIYSKEFYKNNKSKISDHFIGFYKNEQICTNCQNIFPNNENCSWFYYINFNLNEISKYLNYNNNNNNNYFNNFINDNNNISINLNNCFDYTFLRFLKKYPSYCNCLNTQKYIFNSILILPDVLTIILSNNNYYNFSIEDELNLKKYLNNEKIDTGDNVYLLISILCQFSYNKKFIIYCVNPNDGFWYCYTDNKVIRVQKMDINAVPLVFIYQKRGTICYEYQNIVIQNNKIMLTVKFNNSIPEIKLYFEPNKTIKDIIKKIKTVQNLEESEITLLINGKKANANDVLSKNSDALAIIN